jgi:glutamate/tyrosine decarboxylase-like PLP-dependent enzyme
VALCSSLQATCKHYSWRKADNVFGLGGEAFWNADLDSEGRLDVDALHGLIARARDEGRPVTTQRVGASELDPWKKLRVDGSSPIWP